LKNIILSNNNDEKIKMFKIIHINPHMKIVLNKGILGCKTPWLVVFFVYMQQLRQKFMIFPFCL